MRSCPLVTFKGANSITVTFQTKPQWPPGHRELAFLRTFNFHATTGAGPGHTVVTILCDRADRYASKMFNIAFLRERGLPTPEWLEKEAERNEGGVEAAVARAVLAS